MSVTMSTTAAGRSTRSPHGPEQMTHPPSSRGAQPEQPSTPAQPDHAQPAGMHEHESTATGSDSRRLGERQHDRIRARYYTEASQSSRSDDMNRGGSGSASDPAASPTPADAASADKPPPDRWQPALDEAAIEHAQQQGPGNKS